jgi:predicted metal-dependent phosphoesterase TrpH
LKIDFHVHCRERSGCATVSEAEQIQAAIRSGLDAIVFCDHDRLAGRQRLAVLNRKYSPFRLFSGIEITLANEHILVIGLQDPALESCDWEYEDLHQHVRQHQGYMVLAHPFRYRDISIDLEKYPPDAIEVYSSNTPAFAEGRIRQIAAGLGCELLSNSDAHNTQMIGKFYNEVAGDPVDDTSLICALKQKSPQPCHQVIKSPAGN